ncbi:MFS transporter [Marinomonas piezotolerans]|uniref:MFS transporter n=1 Tax=Marinomonas piezotolerans TaxID=2213058 RepID=UPI00248314CA|nr:MFS transporter [Marinomonas piezotolerans]
MYKKDAAPIAWPLFGYFFFFIAVVGIVMPYLSVYYKSIGFSGSQIGRLMATFTLASIFMPHFWGWLTTKTGKPKRTVQIAAVGCFLGFIPFLWVTDFYWLWGLTIFVAMFYAAMTPMGDALAVRSIKHLDVPYSRIRVGGSIGYIVSVTLVGSLIGWFSESVIIPSVVICLGLTLLTTLKLKEQSFEPPARDGSGRFMTLLSERRSYCLLVSRFCLI